MSFPLTFCLLLPYNYQYHPSIQHILAISAIANLLNFAIYSSGCFLEHLKPHSPSSTFPWSPQVPWKAQPSPNFFASKSPHWISPYWESARSTSSSPQPKTSPTPILFYPCFNVTWPNPKHGRLNDYTQPGNMKSFCWFPPQPKPSDAHSWSSAPSLSNTLRIVWLCRLFPGRGHA